MGEPASDVARRTQAGRRPGWRCGVSALLVLALSNAVAGAAETDQYFAWGQPLADATDALDAKMNLEIGRALEAASRRAGGPPPCEAIARELKGSLAFKIFHPLEVWADHSSLVPRLPASPLAELDFRRSNINGYHGPFDFGRWIPDSPIVELNGVRLGTDKLGHFVSSGWRYRRRYLAARRDGLSDQEAQRAAVRWGVFEERSINGLLGDGVFSRADLEADYQGMRFYLDLCQGPNPLLELVDGRWRVGRPFDWSAYVTPEWDESYQVSIYSRSRWRKVRPALLGVCGRRNDPGVQRRLERYRLADRQTPTEEAVDEMIRSGRLPAPAQFSLDAICPPLEPVADRVPASGDGPAPAPNAGVGNGQPQDELMRMVAERERDREPRVYALAGAQLSYPQRLAASLGWFVTRPPAEFDCHTVCDLRGVFAQLQPGLAGGQLSVGYARIFGETGRHQRWLSDPYLGVGFKGAVLRTWGREPLGAAGLTFVGLEGEFTITRVSFSLGVFQHVGERTAKHARFISGGLGWGF